MGMKYIDLETWKRKEHFAFFYRNDYPQYNICMNLDVNHFLGYVRENNLSFYYSMIYAVTDVLNSMEEFRYRIREGKIVLYDRIHPSFTDMDRDSGDDLFKVVTVDMKESLMEFEHSAREASINQPGYFDLENTMGRDDLIYITCLPRVSFTSLSHTISLKKDDSVPRISWGKFYQDGHKVQLPFSVQVNHALLDGIHVEKYIEKLQTYLNELP